MMFLPLSQARWGSLRVSCITGMNPVGSNENKTDCKSKVNNEINAIFVRV